MYALGLPRMRPPQLSDLRVSTPVVGFTPDAYLHSACCCSLSSSASEKSAPSTARACVNSRERES